MSRKKRTDEALDRVRQAAAQLQPAAAKVKPLAGFLGRANIGDTPMKRDKGKTLICRRLPCFANAKTWQPTQLLLFLVSLERFLVVLLHVTDG